MSKKPDKFKFLFGKYWVFQFFIIGVLILYGSIATVSLFVLTENNQILSTQKTNTVVVTIIFESNVPQKPITWNPIVEEVKTNTSLFTVMNENLNLTGVWYNNSGGYFVKGINSIEQYSINTWNLYYFLKGSGWIYSSKGVSEFILNHDYQIKWVFGPSS